MTLVKVAGHRANGDSGGVYFVDVRFRKARLLEALLKRPLASGASLQPAAAVLGGATEKQQRKIDLNQMEQSQETAAAVALRRLGYHVKVRLPRVVISAVERNAPAATALRPRDRLLAVDGAPVHSVGRLRQPTVTQSKTRNAVEVTAKRSVFTKGILKHPHQSPGCEGQSIHRLQ